MHPRIRTLIVILAGAGLVWWFISGLDLPAVAAILRSARLWPLVCGVVLVNLTLVVRGLRWQAFLKPIARVSFRNTFAATAIGFGSLFVFGRAGEIVRPAILSLRERLRPSVTLATLFIERVCDTAAVVLLFSVNLIFFEPRASTTAPPGQIAAIRNLGALLAAGVIAGILILVCLRLRAAAVILFLEERLVPLAPRAIRPIANFVRHLIDGLSVLTNRAELATTLAHTALVWLLIAAANWLIPIAFGTRFTLSESLFLLGMGLVGSLVPTPGGAAGAYHAAAASGLRFLGVEPNLAASIAIVSHLIGFGPPFLLAVYFLIRDDLRLGDIREILAGETTHPSPTSPPETIPKGDPPR